MELSLTSIKSSSIPLRYRLAGMGHLIGIGAIMRGSGVAFLPGWIAGALGDWLSYWVGRSIAEMWPFSRHPDLLSRGEAFIKKWSALAILIGRFSAGRFAHRCPSSLVSWACPIGRFSWQI